MNKIIKITDDEIIVGKDDGSVLKVKKSSVNWKAKVGDAVDIFADGDETILSLSKQYVQKKDCKILQCLVKGCQKILPIVFSSLVGLFLILTIIACAVPHGKRYSYKEEVFGIMVKSEITFSGKKMTVKNTYTGHEESTTLDYKIKKGKLLYFSESDGEYLEFGTISSTKIVVDNSENYKLFFIEKGLTAFKNISIVFLVISAVLDALCITVLILTKKGIIKLELAKGSENSSQNLEEKTTEKE